MATKEQENFNQFLITFLDYQTNPRRKNKKAVGYSQPKIEKGPAV